MSGAIIALDLGTKTGWATRTKKGERAKSGTLNLTALAKRNETTRYGALLRWMKENVSEGDTVAFEDVAFMVSVRQAHVYGGLRAIVETMCCELRAECVPVAVATIKKHATGRGNAKKPDMMRAARRRGYTPKDDNEADALALLSFMEGRH